MSGSFLHYQDDGAGGSGWLNLDQVTRVEFQAGKRLLVRTSRSGERIYFAGDDVQRLLDALAARRIIFDEQEGESS